MLARDTLRAMAARQGLTIDALVRQLARTERQRTMGDADRERGLRVDEAALLAAAAGQVGDLIKKDEEEREGR